jgi:hypothetical protein
MADRPGPGEIGRNVPVVFRLTPGRKRFLSMLREHINDIRIRWSPKERRGAAYDPLLFLETPEQARRLIKHLQDELHKARKEKNKELIFEVGEILARVEILSRKFFRWEENLTRALDTQELREIKKLPLGF